MRQTIWSAATLAVLLASGSMGAVAGLLPEFSYELDGVSMAKLRGAIPLPRPDTAITDLVTYTNQFRPPQTPYAKFETEVFETGPGYLRNRVGWCQTAQGQWTCRGSDTLVLDNGVRAGVPTTMPTALAMGLVGYAQKMAPGKRNFFVLPENGDEFKVDVIDSKDCHSILSLRRKGDTFEVMCPDWQDMKACV